MDMDNPQVKAYLYELYTRTKGDPQVQVSMYEVGGSLGLERNEARKMAEDLFIDGYAELKTLAGGIGITSQGLEFLDVKIVLQPDNEAPSLGSNTILEVQGKEAVEKIIGGIKESLTGNSKAYIKLEEMVIDIKTIEVQMLSPNPKTAVIREILRSLSQSIEGEENQGLKGKLETLISS